METHIFHSRFWHDEYAAALTSNEKLYFLYLLYNEYVNVAGVYELPRVIVRAVLGFPDSELDQMQKKFQEDGKITFFKGWVRVVNFTKYRKYKGEKNEAAIKRIVQNSPKQLYTPTLEQLRSTEPLLDTPSIPYAYPIDSPKDKKLEIRNKKRPKSAKGIDTLSARSSPDPMDTIRQKMGWPKRARGGEPV